MRERFLAAKMSFATELRRDSSGVPGTGSDPSAIDRRRELGMSCGVAAREDLLDGDEVSMTEERRRAFAISIGEGAEPRLERSLPESGMRERLREAMMSSAIEPRREAESSSVVEPRREGGPERGAISSSTTDPRRTGAAWPWPAKRTAAVKAVDTRVGVCILTC